MIVLLLLLLCRWGPLEAGAVAKLLSEDLPLPSSSYHGIAHMNVVGEGGGARRKCWEQDEGTKKNCNHRWPMVVIGIGIGTVGLTLWLWRHTDVDLLKLKCLLYAAKKHGRQPMILRWYETNLGSLYIMVPSALTERSENNDNEVETIILICVLEMGTLLLSTTVPWPTRELEGLKPPSARIFCVKNSESSALKA